MAYTAQTITDLTSEASFFEAVQTFFQNNGFTVVENFSSNTGYFRNCLVSLLKRI